MVLFAYAPAPPLCLTRRGLKGTLTPSNLNATQEQRLRASNMHYQLYMHSFACCLRLHHRKRDAGLALRDGLFLRLRDLRDRAQGTSIAVRFHCSQQRAGLRSAITKCYKSLSCVVSYLSTGTAELAVVAETTCRSLWPPRAAPVDPGAVGQNNMQSQKKPTSVQFEGVAPGSVAHSLEWWYPQSLSWWSQPRFA